ncbi:hypothetical protein [Pseudomonas juntendi]|uniref:hypothetical protein n=1 Tax=Pseudomonas juntendi TaxID=2666183 RepID=UPI00137AB078|nr:hypothetical protein [Pseudomonas juntendi]
MAGKEVEAPDSIFSKRNGELFKKHFPSGTDEETAVLKGHLLVESMLRDFCMNSVPNPAHLKGARLTFKQITLLARSLCNLPVPGLEYIWTLVSKLNQLRNLMAHELEPDQAKKDSLCSSLIKTVNEHKGNSEYSCNSLENAICYMCDLLDAYLQIGLAIERPEFKQPGQQEIESE